jgi:anaerobic C4-dicarboxylate transporter
MKGIGLVQILAICIPSTLIGVIVAALVADAGSASSWTRIPNTAGASRRAS